LGRCQCRQTWLYFGYLPRKPWAGRRTAAGRSDNLIGTMSVNAKAWVGIGLLAVAMGLLLFLPAGAIRWWEAWIYLGVFFGASIPITIYLMRHDPALLERRLAAGPIAEKEPAQKVIMLMASFGFIATLVVPALDYRYSWSAVPTYVVLLGDALAALCFAITFLVYKENTF